MRNGGSLAHKLILLTIIGVVTASLTGSVWASGTILISSQGTLSLTSDKHGFNVSLDSLLTLEIDMQTWQASTAITTQDNQLTNLKFVDKFAVGTEEFDAEVGFVPQSAAFTYAQVRSNFSIVGLQIAGIARLEENGLGWGLDIHNDKSAVVQSVRLRFNLKEYSDELVTSGFCPVLSDAKVEFHMPGLCNENIAVELNFDGGGFGELSVRIGPPLELFPWLALGMTMTFHTGEKAVNLSPALSLSSPPCFDFYWGIDWDSDSNTINGLKLYGLGVHAKIGRVRVRSLTSFAPDEIALVKSPYWEMFAATIPISICDGGGEVDIAVYFGDMGLFNVGEVDTEVTVPVFSSWRVTLGVTALVATAPSLTISWSGKF